MKLLIFESRLFSGGSSKILPGALENLLYDVTYIFLVLSIQPTTLITFCFLFCTTKVNNLAGCKRSYIKAGKRKGNISFLKLMLLFIICYFIFLVPLIMLSKCCMYNLYSTNEFSRTWTSTRLYFFIIEFIDLFERL